MSTCYRDLPFWGPNWAPEFYVNCLYYWLKRELPFPANTIFQKISKIVWMKGKEYLLFYINTFLGTYMWIHKKRRFDLAQNCGQLSCLQLIQHITGDVDKQVNVKFLPKEFKVEHIKHSKNWNSFSKPIKLKKKSSCFKGKGCSTQRDLFCNRQS